VPKSNNYIFGIIWTWKHQASTSAAYLTYVIALYAPNLLLPLRVAIHSSIATSNVQTPTPASSPAFFPNPIYLFSATVNLGKSLGPIPLIEGGLRVVETIVGGTIYGPGFNATIEGGVAALILVDNGDGIRTQIPYVYACGTGDDGSQFYMQEDGIGSGRVQNTRLTINVGGKYQALQTMYVLGRRSVSEDRTVAYVECFSVPLPPGS
jgi:hypothetical protein